MKKMKLVGIVLAFICYLTACGKSNIKNADEVRIAYFPNITHTQALVMKSQGTLEKELGDVQVKWTAFNAGPAEVEALFAGEIDLGYIGPVPAIQAYVKSDGDLHIIAGATNGGAVLVTRKDLVLNNVKELSGLKVAIPQLGNTQHLSLLHLLSENDLTTKSDGGTVDIVAAQNSDIKSLMDTGKIDAALVPEPWGTILETDIGANVLLDSKELWRDGDYSTAVVIVSKDFKDNNPEIVKKFLQVHKDATLYINNNLEEAKSIVNKEILTVTGASIDTRILASAFNRLIISDAISKESIKAFAEIDKQEGFIEKLPGEGLIDDSLLSTLK